MKQNEEQSSLQLKQFQKRFLSIVLYNQELFEDQGFSNFDQFQDQNNNNFFIIVNIVNIYLQLIIIFCVLIFAKYIKSPVENMIISTKNNDEDASFFNNDQEEGLSTLRFTSSQKSKSKAHRQKQTRKCPQGSWKKWLIAITLSIVIGLIFYYISARCENQITLLVQQQKKKDAVVQSTLKDSQTAIKQLTQNKYSLQNQIVSLKSELEKANKIIVEKNNEILKKIPAQQSKATKYPLTQENPNKVIDIKYSSTSFSALPINPLKKNAENKGIADALYKDDSIRKKRQQFTTQRINFVNSKTNFAGLFLTKYNLILTQQQLRQSITENEKEWKRLQDKFQLQNIKQELEMCIIVPGFNNNANFRIQANLNSIFTQNYTNYKVVVINDASTDSSGDVYRKYFDFYAIDKAKYFYIENQKRVTALQNIYLTSINQCGKNSIVVTLDADDQFIGRNVLKVFNHGYQTKKSGVIYSNFYWFQQPQTLMYGFTSEYSENEKKNNLYRGNPMKFSHLRSYRTQLIYEINPKDLQDEKGVFFTIAYDMALFFPLMQLSCGRVNKIEGQFHYLYNVGTGLNDYQDRGRQVAVDNRVRGQKKYECFKQFDDRMNK